MADTGSDAKPRIAVFSGPTATIQNSEPLVTSNKAREKYGLPVRAEQRRLADAFRRAARAALGCAGDGLCRAIQRPPARARSRRALRATGRLSRRGRYFSQRTHRSPTTNRFTRLRSNLKTVSIRCPTWRAKLTDSHGRWTARKKIFLPNGCACRSFPTARACSKRSTDWVSPTKAWGAC